MKAPPGKHSIIRLCAAVAGARGPCCVLMAGLVLVTASACTGPSRGARGLSAALRAEEQRTARLDLEVERLRADLSEAESALVRIEGGMRGSTGRADAVSAVAEARIALDSAAARVTWRKDEIGRARTKLREADAQLKRGNFGSAVFFASRAERMAQAVIRESEIARDGDSLLYVTGGRVNVRAGPSTDNPVLTVVTRGTPVHLLIQEGRWLQIGAPSGEIGWIHSSYLGPKP